MDEIPGRLWLGLRLVARVSKGGIKQIVIILQRRIDESGGEDLVLVQALIQAACAHKCVCILQVPGLQDYVATRARACQSIPQSGCKRIALAKQETCLAETACMVARLRTHMELMLVCTHFKFKGVAPTLLNTCECMQRHTCR